MAAILAALASAPLAAQERVVPAVGDQVRIASAAAPGRLRGELVAVRGDTLVVISAVTLRSVAVPLSQVDRIDVRRRRSGWEGLGRGLLYGVPFGFGGGYLLGTISEGRHCGDDCGLLPAVGAAAGLVTGTVLGVVFGVGMPGGRWVQGERPADRSLALGLSLPTR
jgi:hypothetical protein